MDEVEGLCDTWSATRIRIKWGDWGVEDRGACRRPDGRAERRGRYGLNSSGSRSDKFWERKTVGFGSHGHWNWGLGWGTLW